LLNTIPRKKKKIKSKFFTFLTPAIFIKNRRWKNDFLNFISKQEKLFLECRKHQSSDIILKRKFKIQCLSFKVSSKCNLEKVNKSEDLLLLCDKKILLKQNQKHKSKRLPWFFSYEKNFKKESQCNILKPIFIVIFLK